MNCPRCNNVMFKLIDSYTCTNVGCDLLEYEYVDTGRWSSKIRIEDYLISTGVMKNIPYTNVAEQPTFYK